MKSPGTTVHGTGVDQGKIQILSAALWNYFFLIYWLSMSCCNADTVDDSVEVHLKGTVSQVARWSTKLKKDYSVLSARMKDLDYRKHQIEDERVKLQCQKSDLESKVQRTQQRLAEVEGTLKDLALTETEITDEEAQIMKTIDQIHSNEGLIKNHLMSIQALTKEGHDITIQ